MAKPMKKVPTNKPKVGDIVPPKRPVPAQDKTPKAPTEAKALRNVKNSGGNPKRSPTGARADGTAGKVSKNRRPFKPGASK